METDKPRALSSAPGPGARGWTCRPAINLCLIFIPVIISASTAVGKEFSTDSLVAEAARPEVFYGDPARRDSLIGVLAGGGSRRISELLGLLETPWAAYFEVIRRSLEKTGGPAREAVLERLAAGKMDRGAALLLVVLEKLGATGDENSLRRFLQSGQPPVMLPAIRCLAQFGGPIQAKELLTPLLADSLPQVRLAAVWALGRVCQRDSSAPVSAALTGKIRSLLEDPQPLVRFSAAETLEIISGDTTGIPRPLTPTH